MKRDSQGNEPAVGDEHQGRGEKGFSQGDLQAGGERIRWRSISWPHLGQSIWSCQDGAGDGLVAGWSGCSVRCSVTGNKFCCRVGRR